MPIGSQQAVQNLSRSSSQEIEGIFDNFVRKYHKYSIDPYTRRRSPRIDTTIENESEWKWQQETYFPQNFPIPIEKKIYTRLRMVRFRGQHSAEPLEQNQEQHTADG